MSHQEQASYLISLPMTQFTAIRKAVSILSRSGMPREMALSIIVEQHQISRQKIYNRISESTR